MVVLKKKELLLNACEMSQEKFDQLVVVRSEATGAVGMGGVFFVSSLGCVVLRRLGRLFIRSGRGFRDAVLLVHALIVCSECAGRGGVFCVCVVFCRWFFGVGLVTR